MNTHDCGACPLQPDRRQFLSQALLAVAGVMAALSVTSAAARAASVSFVQPLSGDTETRRYPIPEHDGAQIDKESEVILVRWQNAIYAFALSCPHQRTMLRWREEDTRFQCPKHKSKYQPDGSFIEGRATRGMDRYTITRADDGVLVDLAKLHKQNEDAAAWQAALVRL